jgi:CheY-like chemotaxis protein
MNRLKNKLALIVDDEERNRFALGSYLEMLDMKIKTSENGSEALDLLKEGKMPDIILLDMMMPVMDGFEVLAALKADSAVKHIPVIAVTARAMKGDKEKCIEAGAWDYISKPLDMALLVDKLNRWIA